MKYLVSRRWLLPQPFKSPLWLFNLWSRQQWPYRDLVVGDRLVLVQTQHRKILYEVEVDKVHQSPYSSKKDAEHQLENLFNSLDELQEHFVKAPKIGYLLAFHCKHIRNINRPRSLNSTLPRLGWIRDKTELRRWGV